MEEKGEKEKKSRKRWRVGGKGRGGGDNASGIEEDWNDGTLLFSLRGGTDRRRRLTGGIFLCF
jgi:hypothetical protein